MYTTTSRGMEGRFSSPILAQHPPQAWQARAKPPWPFASPSPSEEAASWMAPHRPGAATRLTEQEHLEQGQRPGGVSVPCQAPSIPRWVLPAPRAGCSPTGAALQRWPSLEAALQSQLGKTSQRQISSTGRLPPLLASVLPWKTRDPTQGSCYRGRRDSGRVIRGVGRQREGRVERCLTTPCGFDRCVNDCPAEGRAEASQPALKEQRELREGQQAAGGGPESSRCPACTTCPAATSQQERSELSCSCFGGREAAPNVHTGPQACSETWLHIVKGTLGEKQSVPAAGRRQSGSLWWLCPEQPRARARITLGSVGRGDLRAKGRCGRVRDRTE